MVLHGRTLPHQGRARDARAISTSGRVVGPKLRRYTAPTLIGIRSGHEEASMRYDRRTFLRGATAGLAAAVVARIASRVEGQGMAKIKPGQQDVLLVIDVQNCFTPGGSLAVKDGDAIIPLINRLATGFPHVVLTQDWHTAGHVSFASSHPGKKPFETTSLAYGTQVLWPDHCVQGTDGAALHKDLKVPHAELVIRKGYRQQMDSYSAFYEADGKTPTGLAGYLRERGLNQVFLVGLATDFCVAWSALDARKAGFSALVIEDACRGIDVNGSLGKAWQDMQGAGVKRVQSTDIDV
jgi:nicotinamidase/pyrazinamidase